MPGPAFSARTLTEHGQARLRLRIRHGVLKGEDHGTVSRLPRGQNGLLVQRLSSVDASNGSGTELVARDSEMRKKLNQKVARSSGPLARTSNGVHLFPRIGMRKAGPDRC